MTRTTANDQQHYAPWLWLLLGLFCFRVCGQLIQSRFAVPFLPAFEQWQGSSLPYGVLLASQIVIIAMFAFIAWRFSSGRITPRPALGATLLALGGVYFAVMLARLVLGLTVLSHSHWFASHIPAFFHLVLAGFIVLVGHFHWRNRKPAHE
jgi:hypothetical protein